MKNTLITKGRGPKILSIYEYAIDKDGNKINIKETNNKINDIYEQLSSEGYMTLAVAYKDSKYVYLLLMMMNII